MQQQRGGDRRRNVIPKSVAAPHGEQWPDALVALYAAERTELVRAAFLVSGSVAAAEDAVHDAMARVAAKWTAVDNGRSYLYVSVVNAARDAARRESRAARLFTNRAEVQDDTAALSAASSALRAALARLPVNQRAAIVLRYYLDWDDNEIADALRRAPRDGAELGSPRHHAPAEGLATMIDFEETLRDALATLACEGVPAVDAPLRAGVVEMRSQAAASNRGRRRVLAVAVALALVVASVAIAVSLRNGAPAARVSRPRHRSRLSRLRRSGRAATRWRSSRGRK